MTVAVLEGSGFILGTAALTLLCYLLMRYLTGGDPEQHTKDLAGSVIFRVSALHGLILALVFAQEMVDYQQLKFESTVEANAIADVYFDARRYDPDLAPTVQEPIKNYLELVVSREWDHLAEGKGLFGPAWGQWDAAYEAVLDLKPSDARQESLRSHMLDRIHVISETRVKRENHAAGSISAMFWFAAMAGVVLIALAYYPYPVQRHNVMLIVMFGAFTGLVLFFISAFSNPFDPPGAIGTGPYLRLIEQIARS